MSSSQPTREELADKHLADLHALAAERGVERYRMLPRTELIEAILVARREGDGGFSLGRLLGRLVPSLGGKGEGGKVPAASADGLERVTGRLEISRRGHGFLRPGSQRSDDDVFVSVSQIRRCELKDGDELSGPVRPPRERERHRSLARVELVNGRALKD